MPGFTVMDTVLSGSVLPIEDILQGSGNPQPIPRCLPALREGEIRKLGSTYLRDVAPEVQQMHNDWKEQMRKHSRTRLMEGAGSAVATRRKLKGTKEGSDIPIVEVAKWLQLPDWDPKTKQWDSQSQLTAHVVRENMGRVLKQVEEWLTENGMRPGSEVAEQGPRVDLLLDLYKIADDDDRKPLRGEAGIRAARTLKKWKVLGVYQSCALFSETLRRAEASFISTLPDRKNPWLVQPGPTNKRGYLFAELLQDIDAYAVDFDVKGDGSTIVFSAFGYGNRTCLANDPNVVEPLHSKHYDHDHSSNVAVTLVLIQGFPIPIMHVLGKDIQAGEEIRYSYGLQYWNLFHDRMSTVAQVRCTAEAALQAQLAEDVLRRQQQLQQQLQEEAQEEAQDEGLGEGPQGSESSVGAGLGAVAGRIGGMQGASSWGAASACSNDVQEEDDAVDAPYSRCSGYTTSGRKTLPVADPECSTFCAPAGPRHSARWRSHPALSEHHSEMQESSGPPHSAARASAGGTPASVPIAPVQPTYHTPSEATSAATGNHTIPVGPTHPHFTTAAATAAATTISTAIGNHTIPVAPTHPHFAATAAGTSGATTSHTIPVGAHHTHTGNVTASAQRAMANHTQSRDVTAGVSGATFNCNRNHTIPVASISTQHVHAVATKAGANSVHSLTPTVPLGHMQPPPVAAPSTGPFAPIHPVPGTKAPVGGVDPGMDGLKLVNFLAIAFHNLQSKMPPAIEGANPLAAVGMSPEGLAAAGLNPARLTAAGIPQAANSAAAVHAGYPSACNAPALGPLAAAEPTAGLTAPSPAAPAPVTTAVQTTVLAPAAGMPATAAAQATAAAPVAASALTVAPPAAGPHTPAPDAAAHFQCSDILPLPEDPVFLSPPGVARVALKLKDNIMRKLKNFPMGIKILSLDLDSEKLYYGFFKEQAARKVQIQGKPLLWIPQANKSALLRYLLPTAYPHVFSISGNSLNKQKIHLSDAVRPMLEAALEQEAATHNAALAAPSKPQNTARPSGTIAAPHGHTAPAGRPRPPPPPTPQVPNRIAHGFHHTSLGSHTTSHAPLTPHTTHTISSGHHTSSHASGAPSLVATAADAPVPAASNGQHAAQQTVDTMGQQQANGRVRPEYDTNGSDDSDRACGGGTVGRHGDGERQLNGFHTEDSKRGGVVCKTEREREHRGADYYKNMYTPERQRVIRGCSGYKRCDDDMDRYADREEAHRNGRHTAGGHGNGRHQSGRHSNGIYGNRGNENSSHCHDRDDGKAREGFQDKGAPAGLQPSRHYSNRYTHPRCNSSGYDADGYCGTRQDAGRNAYNNSTYAGYPPADPGSHPPFGMAGAPCISHRTPVSKVEQGGETPPYGAPVLIPLSMLESSAQESGEVPIASLQQPRLPQQHNLAGSIKRPSEFPPHDQPPPGLRGCAASTAQHDPHGMPAGHNGHSRAGAQRYGYVSQPAGVAATAVPLPALDSGHNRGHQGFVGHRGHGVRIKPDPEQQAPAVPAVTPLLEAAQPPPGGHGIQVPDVPHNSASNNDASRDGGYPIAMDEPVDSDFCWSEDE